MICSIPTVKSGSTWLDRLRSTKGFPTADGLDLGHFLLSNNNNQNSNPESDSNPNPNPNSPESTQSDDKRAVVDNRKNNSTGRNGGGVTAEDGGGGGAGGESEWFGIMSNVLADLFNMNNGGEVDRRRRKKSLRKQRNPRICLVPTAAAAEAVEEEERSSGGCERKDENALAENNNAVDCEEEEEEKEGQESGGGERELLGFSRNEVTVIDTSCMEWKFEKLVYRKRNVWKVREKKGKSKFVGRKRRKGGAGSEDGKKKMKVSNESGGGGGGGEGGGVPPLKNGQSPQDDKSGEVGKGPSDDLSQVPQKRASLSRLRKKTKTGSSSVVLIKGSSASNKTKSHKSHGSRPEFEQRESGSNKPLLATFLKGKESGNGR